MHPTSRSPSPTEIFKLSPNLSPDTHSKAMPIPRSGRQGASSGTAHAARAALPSARPLRAPRYNRSEISTISRFEAKGQVVKTVDSISQIVGLAILGASSSWPRAHEVSAIETREYNPMQYWLPHISTKLPTVIEDFCNLLFSVKKGKKASVVIDWKCIADFFAEKKVEPKEMISIKELFALVQKCFGYFLQKTTHGQPLHTYIIEVKCQNEASFKKYMEPLFAAEVKVAVVEEAKNPEDKKYEATDELILRMWNELVDRPDFDPNKMLPMIEDCYRRWTMTNVCALVSDLKKVETVHLPAFKRVNDLLMFKENNINIED